MEEEEDDDPEFDVVLKSNCGEKWLPEQSLREIHLYFAGLSINSERKKKTEQISWQSRRA